MKSVNARRHIVLRPLATSSAAADARAGWRDGRRGIAGARWSQIVALFDF
jgi:hypothetical protein